MMAPDNNTIVTVTVKVRATKIAVVICHNSSTINKQTVKKEIFFRSFICIRLLVQHERFILKLNNSKLGYKLGRLIKLPSLFKPEPDQKNKIKVQSVVNITMPE